MNEPATVAAPPTLSGRRVVAVDVARGVALLSMMTVHVMPGADGEGRVTGAYVVASGRASALFAVLAGVGLALLTGGPARRVPPGTRAAVLTRALIVAALGMFLVAFQPPVAVILTNYGLLFAVAVPFLRVRRAVLVAVAGAWLLLAPLLSHLVRTGREPGPGPQPSFADLADPLSLLDRLVVTGYYPVLTWTPYLLVGLALGRTNLQSRGIGLRLLAGGLALALLAWLTSTLLLATDGWTALRRSGPAEEVGSGFGLPQLQLRSLHGAPPTTTWWWQAVVSPHSGTPFDLAQTIGSALAVVGLSLFLVQLTPRWRGAGGLVGRGALTALAATGSTTLSLYSLHVVIMSTGIGRDHRVALLLFQVVVVVVLASLWRSSAPRGPLEQAVATASGAVRDAVARTRQR
ncbi:MAG TPA: heparan-alpha-glucosaminide N-acetyltransferase domain-containing protein [Actinomycetales bacterium]|nr:heparan-alpha-glucosaminide N-acetyltransferase domain-containing protein [Actinomycetales bacterium]